jgi:hypothetical protein
MVSSPGPRPRPEAVAGVRVDVGDGVGEWIEGVPLGAAPCKGVTVGVQVGEHGVAVLVMVGVLVGGIEVGVLVGGIEVGVLVGGIGVGVLVGGIGVGVLVGGVGIVADEV